MRIETYRATIGAADREWIAVVWAHEEGRDLVVWGNTEREALAKAAERLGERHGAAGKKWMRRDDRLERVAPDDVPTRIKEGWRLSGPRSH